MKKSEIIKNIRKSEKIPVDQKWLKQGRHSLHNFINDNPVRKSEPVRQQMHGGIFNKLTLDPMPIAIIALIVTLITGGGVASAAQNSLPTDILYSIKLTTESIQESLTFNKEKKIELQTKLAERRLTEIENLQNKGKEVSKEVLEKSLNRFTKRLAIAQAHLSSIEGGDNTDRKIAAAIRLEDSIARHQQILENIGSRAGPDHQSALAHAKTVALENSNMALEKISRPFVGLIAKAQLPEDAAVSALTAETGTAEIPPTLQKIVNEKYAPHLKIRAKNSIEKAKHKLEEIKKKIDVFSSHNRANCNADEKDNQIKKLKTHLEKMLTALESAQELYDDARFLSSLNQSNYLFKLVIEIDNFIGKWNSSCDHDNKQGQIIELNHKFILELNETVSIKGHNINIHLSQLPYTCPKCEDGKICALAPCLIDHALFTVSFPPKELAQLINLGVNQQQKIAGDIYLKLLDISQGQVTAIVVQEDIAIPENIKVNFNEKFELFTSWTASLINRDNLRITFQRSEILNCVTAPCPSAAYFLVQEQGNCPAETPTEEIDYGIRKEILIDHDNATTASSCAISVRQIRLVEGETEVITRAQIKLLAVDQDSVTMIIKPVLIACPLYAPPAPGWCDEGEVVPGKIDVNGCQGPPICVSELQTDDRQIPEPIPAPIPQVIK